MASTKYPVSKAEIIAVAKTRKRLSVDRATVVATALRMKNCNLKNFLKIKQGMTNQEKSDALDSAVASWLNCLGKH